MHLIRMVEFAPIRFSLVIIFILGFRCSIYSQSEPSKSYKFHFGLTSGVHLSMLHVQQQYAGASNATNSLNSKPTLSYHFGVPLTVTHNHFVFSGRLLFVNDKTQTSIRDDFNGTTLRQTSNYSWIALPLAFNYIFIQKSRQQFFVGLGINPRKLLSVYTKVSQVFGPVTITGNKIDAFDTYKEWSLFGEAILGADLVVAKRFPFTVTLSFDQSLTNLANEFKGNASLILDYGFVQPKINMSSASLSLFYFIK